MDFIRDTENEDELLAELENYKKNFVSETDQDGIDWGKHNEWREEHKSYTQEIYHSKNGVKYSVQNQDCDACYSFNQLKPIHHCDLYMETSDIADYECIDIMYKGIYFSFVKGNQRPIDGLNRSFINHDLGSCNICGVPIRFTGISVDCINCSTSAFEICEECYELRNTDDIRKIIKNRRMWYTITNFDRLILNKQFQIEYNDSDKDFQTINYLFDYQNVKERVDNFFNKHLILKRCKMLK
jgi:hypothetical protein